jgi:hypothetical protein
MESQTPLRALIIHHVITVLILVGALVLSVWGYLHFRKQGFFYEQESAQASPLERRLELNQRERISLAIRAYYQLHNNWPLSLDQLVAEGLLLPSDLSYPSPRVVYSLRTENGRPAIDVKRLSDAAPPEPQSAP